MPTILAPPLIHLVYLIIWRLSQVRATFLGLQFLEGQGPEKPVGGKSRLGERGKKSLFFSSVAFNMEFGSMRIIQILFYMSVIQQMVTKHQFCNQLIF